MQKYTKLAFLILIAASVALLLAQCSVGTLLPVVTGKKIWLSDDKATLTQELRRHIPVGSSISEARAVLQLNEFQCTYQKDSDSVESEPNWTSKEADYLFCYLETSVGTFLMTQIDYDAMSDADLKQYFLEHRSDHTAFQAYLDRLNQRPRRIIASLSDPDFDEKVQAAIRQKLAAARSYQ